MLPILGALTVGPGLKAGRLIGCLVLAAAFHTYAYIFNDVMDLDIDRLEPERAEYPLVRGVVAPAWALTFALAQIPVGYLTALLLGAGLAEYAVLTLSFVAMAVYNVWGKRCPLPPATDLVQGVGWTGLLLFGAFLVDVPTWRTAWACVAVVAYVLLINGVHGGLRDLVNDSACQARTTSIFLGACASADGTSMIPPALIGYAVGLHVIIFACALMVLGEPHAWPVSTEWAASFGLLACAMIGSAVLLVLAHRWRGDGAKLMSVGTWHLFTCMALLALPLLPHADALPTMILTVTFSLPILAMWTYRETR